MRLTRKFLFAALSITISFHAQATGFRDFEGWHVGCDNTGACRAMGFPLDHGLPRGTLTILDRQAGPEGKFRWLRVGPMETDATVFVDGKKIADLLASAFEEGDDKTPQALVDQKLIAAIIAAGLDGKHLAFDADAKENERISLQGFKAAMLYIDEQQGRVGTQSAIVAKGEKPASAVPAAKPVPLLRLKEIPKKGKPDPSLAKAILEFHKRFAKKDECSNIAEGEPSVISSAPLDRKGWVFEVDCWRAAYQAGTILYMFSYEKNHAAAQFAPVEMLNTKTGRVSTTRGRSLSNLGFETAAQIDAFHKGRGVGDCGTSESWRWDGAVYRLADYRIMVACGVDADEDNWITLWRTREK